MSTVYCLCLYCIVRCDNSILWTFNNTEWLYSKVLPELLCISLLAPVVKTPIDHRTGKVLCCVAAWHAPGHDWAKRLENNAVEAQPERTISKKQLRWEMPEVAQLVVFLAIFEP